MDVYPRTVADFYQEVLEKLSSIGVDISIHPSPNEMEPAIPFAENTINKSYDPIAANALWQAMLKANEAFKDQIVQPEEAFYSNEMGEFMLKYEDVRRSENPEKVLHDFLQSTYEAAANTSNWDRDRLER